MLGTVFSQYTFLTDLTQSSGLFKLSRWFQPAPKAEIHTSSYPYLEQDGKKWVAYDNLGSLISSLDIYSEANLCILSHFSHAPLFVSSWTVWPARLLCPWESPGQKTGVGWHFLSDVGIEPNSLYLHWQVVFYHYCQLESKPLVMCLLLLLNTTFISV